MTFVTRLIYGNWPLKLAALGLATVLYAGLALQDSTRSWTGSVPIEVLGAPQGGALLELPGVVDEIQYRASSEAAAQLAADSFRASIDLSAVEPRPGAEPVPVVVDVFPVDPRVRVVDYSPRSVNVRLDEVVTRRRPVTIDTGVVPEGIELGPVVASPSQVAVSGASSRVQNVRTVEGRIPVDASGINIDQDVAMEAFDELGAIVPGVEIDPASVRVTADVARRLGYATLPVMVELNGEPARGFRVDNVSVVPSTITVSGEDVGVRSLESIPTEAVDISGSETELVIDVPYLLPDEVTTFGDGTARVFVTFAVDEGSRSLELGTALTGTSADLTYRLEVPSVTAVVSGPLTLLDELDAADLIAEVPVDGLEPGDHEVAPVLESLPGLSVARTVPETVPVTVGQPS